MSSRIFSFVVDFVAGVGDLAITILLAITWWTIRRTWKVTVPALVVLVALQLWCMAADEMRGFDKPNHPLRPAMQRVLKCCFKENYQRAVCAMDDGLSAARIERAMTPAWDDAYLTELLLGGWLAHTLGPAQIDHDTALEVWRRHANCRELNEFLGLTPAQIERLKSQEFGRLGVVFKLVPWLKLRGRGSAILGMLLTHQIRSELVLGGQRERRDEIINQTRRAYVAGGVPFGDGVTYHRTEAERIHARRWLHGRLHERTDARVGIYLMSAYVNGWQSGIVADTQAMLNEWSICSGQSGLTIVDGFAGPGTFKALDAFQGSSSATNSINDWPAVHEAVRVRWKRSVEPQIFQICARAIQTGDATELLPLLRNRYAGHAALYNGFNSLLVVMGRSNPTQAVVAYADISSAWAGWMSRRDERFWRLLTDEQAFQKIFPPDTGLRRSRLVELTAQYYLLYRLAPRQLGRDISLLYRPARWFGLKPRVNTLERINILAGERGWLIDPPDR